MPNFKPEPGKLYLVKVESALGECFEKPLIFIKTDWTWTIEWFVFLNKGQLMCYNLESGAVTFEKLS